MYELEYGMENALDIPDATDGRCRVINYYPSHSILIIQIMTADKRNLHVVFGSVRYFEGTMFWNNANFSVSSLEEHGEFIYRLAPASHPSHKKMPTNLNFLRSQGERLLIINLGTYSIKIIAGAISVEDVTRNMKSSK